MEFCHYTGQARKYKHVSCENTMTFTGKQSVRLRATRIMSWYTLEDNSSGNTLLTLALSAGAATGWWSRRCWLDARHTTAGGLDIYVENTLGHKCKDC